MTDFDDIAPTQGDQGNSFEWIWDIASNYQEETPTFLNVPDITGLTPTPNPKFKDGTTYAHKGQTSQSKVGEDFSLSVQVKGVRDETGEFQPELVALIEAADSVGGSNVIGYRYYHATSPSLAYQGTAAVNWSRVNTGNDDVEFFQFELTGQGDRVKIANPAVEASVPTVTSVLPSGATAGSQVTIKGSGFVGLTGATAVKFGGTNAGSYVVIDSQTIVATLPAGSAGSAPVIVKNPTGDSNAAAYTRGA